MMSIDEQGISLVPKISGAMAEPSIIHSTIRLFYSHDFNNVMTCAGPGISLWEPTASLSRDVILYTDEDEQSRWNTIGDSLLPIELCDWADIMVIAPLSANTPSKIAKGLCDNLLSFVGYAWDFSKPLFVAPAMNTLMWNNLFMQ
ncbi:unnamed protein product [Prunus armeniaca]|uniref:phosphopantothenoylcysteine decarboxylase n=1 Tax=Prunus armeniaca TaxID=36596 RepID=A0A6J5XZB6_PRUAR|nr:unnamed protein product [Prunus armeniaca]CAB4317633.1 unnamed protein product [Prunus armeniaca]